MRVSFFAAAFAGVLASLLARPAAAQESPANAGAGPPVVVEPIPAAAPAALDDQTHVHELNERLFASQALAMDGSRVTRSGIRVDAHSFYTLVGRADLADQVHTRRVAKGLLIGGGAGALTLGVLVGLSNAVCIDSCSSNRSSALPGALILGGVAAILVGAFLPSDPTDSREKNDLVSDYNRRLRASLGLAP